MNQSDVTILAASIFTKSRMYENMYINLDTGIYYPKTQFIEMIISNMNESELTYESKYELAQQSGVDIDFLRDHAADKVEQLRPVWKFFADWFEGKYGVKQSFYDLMNDFESNFNLSTIKYFKKCFAEWTVEMDLARTVKNNNGDMKVIVVR